MLIAVYFINYINHLSFLCLVLTVTVTVTRDQAIRAWAPHHVGRTFAFRRAGGHRGARIITNYLVKGIQAPPKCIFQAMLLMFDLSLSGNSEPITIKEN